MKKTTIRVNSNIPEIWNDVRTCKLSKHEGETGCSTDDAEIVIKLLGTKAANEYECKRENILMRFEEEKTCDHRNDGGSPLFQAAPLPIMVALYTSKRAQISDSRWASSTQWGLHDRQTSEINVNKKLCHISEGQEAMLKDTAFETLTLVEYVKGKGRNEIFDFWR